MLLTLSVYDFYLFIFAQLERLNVENSNYFSSTPAPRVTHTKF